MTAPESRSVDQFSGRVVKSRLEAIRASVDAWLGAVTELVDDLAEAVETAETEASGLVDDNLELRSQLRELELETDELREQLAWERGTK